jgi:two-component system response regulator DesR
MRIAISSRNRLFREGIAALLESKDQAEIVALADTPKECVKKAGRRTPEVIIVDRLDAQRVELDYILGLQVYQRFGLVLIAGCSEDDCAGFTHVICSKSSTAALIKIIHASIPEKLPSRRSARSADPNSPKELSPREAEIGRLISLGLSNGEIGEMLGIKEVTVKNFVALIMGKLGCRNRVKLALMLAERAKGLDASKGPAETAAIQTDQ